MDTEIRIVAGEEKGINVEINGNGYVAVCALETVLGNTLLEAVRPGVPLEQVADEVRDNLMEFFKAKRGDKVEKQPAPEEMDEKELQILIDTLEDLTVSHPIGRQIQEQLAAALNRQLPRAVKFVDDSTSTYCPACGKQIGSRCRFCYKCGQKLKQPTK